MKKKEEYEEGTDECCTGTGIIIFIKVLNKKTELPRRPIIINKINRIKKSI